MNKEAYQQQLAASLPTGPAWERDLSSNIMAILGVIASEFAHLHGRTEQLLREAIPATTQEMLTDWEKAAGLPDECSALGDTLQERVEQLVSKVTRRGGQSKAFFQQIAEEMGYEVVVEPRFRPFIPGISAPGDLIWMDETIRFYWRVRVLKAKLVFMRCGQSTLDERLLDFRQAEDLECILQKLKPAHTVLIVAYEGVEV
ncbi:MAG: DUF2313 domain-containing protein [Alphaproteobacteria bacterium]|nr:DUF2313 domain-containing protein [Alphaproteobacteria bacterium]